MSESRDEFVDALSQPSAIRFSLLEHAPIEQRKNELANCLAKKCLPLTFLEKGITLKVDLESVESTSETLVRYESKPFYFNNAFVKLKGTIDRNELNGQACLEATSSSSATLDQLTPEQRGILQQLGLPV